MVSWTEKILSTSSSRANQDETKDSEDGVCLPANFIDSRSCDVKNYDRVLSHRLHDKLAERAVPSGARFHRDFGSAGAGSASEVPASELRYVP